MDTGSAVAQVGFALAVIVALVFAAAFLFKRFGGLSAAGRGVIRVVAAAPIGARERIVLLEVHGRQLLVGVTASQVSALHVFDADAPRVVAETTDFPTALRAWMGRP